MCSDNNQKNECKIVDTPKRRKANLYERRTSLVSSEFGEGISWTYAKAESYNIFVETSKLSSLLTICAWLEKLDESKTLTMVQEVGPKDLPEMHFLRIHSRDLQCMVDVYRYLKKIRDFFTVVKCDGIIQTEIMGLTGTEAESDIEMEESQAC